MPTIILTAEQAERVRPILDLQNARKIGCLAVVNFGLDRSTGEPTIELSFACLEWSDAVAICRKIKKLAAVARRSSDNVLQPIFAESSTPSRQRSDEPGRL